jgi:hypothetical protein
MARRLYKIALFDGDKRATRHRLYRDILNNLMTQNEWKRAAIHEGGHVIANRYQKIGVSALWLWEDTDTVGGFTEIVPRTSLATNPWPLIVTAYAGYCAEKQVLGNADDEWRFRDDKDQADMQVNVLLEVPQFINHAALDNETRNRIFDLIDSTEDSLAKANLLISLALDAANKLVVAHLDDINRIAQAVLNQPTGPQVLPNKRMVKVCRVLQNPL